MNGLLLWILTVVWVLSLAFFAWASFNYWFEQRDKQKTSLQKSNNVKRKESK